MSFTIRLSLNSGVSNLTNLKWVELFPLLIMKLLIKWEDITQINKIDKSVTYVAVILRIDGEIKKIIASPKITVKSLKHHFFGVLVRNITNHEGCHPGCKNFLRYYFEFLIVIDGLELPFLSFTWLRFLIFHLPLLRKLVYKVLTLINLALTFPKTSVFMIFKSKSFILAAILCRKHSCLYPFFMIRFWFK